MPVTIKPIELSRAALSFFYAVQLFVLPPGRADNTGKAPSIANCDSVPARLAACYYNCFDDSRCDSGTQCYTNCYGNNTCDVFCVDCVCACVDPTP